MAAETVAGKRDEMKRPRVEQPRGHPPAPPKRREDKSGMLPARPPPPPIPLNSTPTEIVFQIREKGLLKAPNPMKSHSERRDKRRHLRQYVHDESSLPDSRPPRDSLSQPKGPVEKQIDAIFGGPASGGDSSSARKAYARSEVGKRLAHNKDLDITFKRAVTNKLYNRRVRPRLVKMGDLAPNWEGPYQVVEVVREGTYTLTTMEG
ncbi:hypothetical protein BHE74_00008790 [Ensete ventricosum]|nr:hypothetical protein BHE74_00008790 [Ensete ventricosum]